MTIGRTNLNGANLSGTGAQFAKLQATMGPGGTVIEDASCRSFIFSNTALNLLPLDGQTFWSTTSPRLVTDHFGGSIRDSRYATGVGTDGDTTTFNISTSTPSTITATTGNSGTVALDSTAIAGPLSFAASDGVIQFSARVKLSAITSVYVWVGLTDTLPTGSTTELPITLSSTTYTANATDAVGFLFDTAATTDVWYMNSVANGTVNTAPLTGPAPVADTYNLLTMQVLPSGIASFWIDGTLIGQMTGVVTTSVSLCPIIVGCTRTTSTRTITADLMATS